MGMTSLHPPLGGPCAAGVVFALAIEADAFARVAQDRREINAGGLVFHEGTVGGRRVAWCVGGVGRERAERATRLLVDGHRPMAIISAGFAGGLDPGLARGSVVRPSAVRGSVDDAHRQLAGQGGPLLVTVDSIMRTAGEKQTLAAQTGAAIVDMETLAVAEAAFQAGLACHGVRVVSDAAGDELPSDIGQLIKPQSAARKAGVVLGLLGRRPRTALDLWSLWERAVVDGRTLATALVELIGRLPSPNAQARPSEGLA
jgi:adenosylhomocysteine nucleosidase